MSEIKTDYVPLAELESPKLRFVAPLPSFVDPRSIGINLNRINLLCRLGGISHLRVEGQTSPETSSFVPTIVGFDTQGSAYAAKTGMKTSVPTYTVDSLPDRGRGLALLGSRWVNGVVQINVDETANRILSETRWRNDAKSSDAWSYYLNRILKGGIVDIGTKHLVLGASRKDYLLEIIPVFSIANSFFGFFGSGNPLAIYAMWYFAVNGLYGYFNINPEGWRQSLLLHGPQLDRALLLKLISLKSTLVRSIPDPTNPTG